MGNCNSQSRNNAAAVTRAGDVKWKQKVVEAEGSATDMMDSQNGFDESALPVSSPDSTLQTFDSPASTLLETPDTSRTSTTSLGSSLQFPHTSLSTPTSTSPVRLGGSCALSTTRQGRALHNRLVKARNVQSALSQTQTRAVSDIDVFGDSFVNSKQSKLSRSTDKPQPNALNDEFEASMSEGMKWAEAELSGKVTCLAMSRREATLARRVPSLYLAVGVDDGTITIHELKEDTPLKTRSSREEHDVTTSTNYSIYDPNACTEDSVEIQLHKTMARRLPSTVAIPSNNGSQIRSLDFSPDDGYLAVGDDDCVCRLYRLLYQENEVDDDELVAVELQAEIHRIDRVFCVRFSPNGRYLAVGGFDGTVAIVLRNDWLTSSLPDVTIEIPREGLIFSVDWSPDSRYLAIGGSDKCCAIVDTQISWNVMREIRRHGSIQDVKWYPTNAHYLAIASTDIAIVDSRNFSVKFEIDCSMMDKEARSSSRLTKINFVCWSPNGTYLVGCGQGQRCNIFETKSFTQVHEFTRSKDVTAVSWGQQNVLSGASRCYLAVGEDGRVVIVKAGLELNAGASSVIDDLSMSICSNTSQRSEWTLIEGEFRDFDDLSRQEGDKKIRDCRTVANSEWNVVAIAFSKGSRSRPSTFFAYSLGNGLVVIRSTSEFKAVAELRFSKPMTTLTFAHGSRLLALGGEDGRVFILETLPSWTVVAERDFESSVRTLSFSKRNERLLVGLQEGTVALLNPVDAYKPCCFITSSTSCVTCSDWAVRSFAIGRMDGSVAIYDAERLDSDVCNPLVVLRPTRSLPVVSSIAFGAAGRFLAVCNSDGHVRIYGAKGGWALCHHIRPHSSLASISWSPSGRYLAFAGDGLLKVVDTIFWTDVGKVSSALLPHDRSQVMSCVAFSQDESALAVAVYGDGARVVRTKDWALSFTHNKA